MSNNIRYYKQKLLPYVVLFFLGGTLFRMVLLVSEYGNIEAHWLYLPAVFVGALADTSVFAYVLAVIMALDCITPRSWGRRIINPLQLFVFSYFMLFITIAEWLFWAEFSSRFNFIAVDYLVYTHEVIGNIIESYPIYWLLLAIAVVALLITRFWMRRLQATSFVAPLWVRGAAFVGAVTLSVTSFLISDNKLLEFSNDRYINDIAKNGFYELFAAYNSSALSFDKFYVTAEQGALKSNLRKMIAQNSSFTDDLVTRKMKAATKEKHYNVIIITIESMSAEFMRAFGNSNNLTPYLDALTSQSLFFNNFFATGTRTVYGLSAINLSIPPIPGNAIMRRPNNVGLFTIASVLNRKGYDSKFIYGGYSYFDDMKNFFSHNGYQVVDRADFTPEEITFANIWGVSDEDLFDKVLQESDDTYKQGKPFFLMVMTTSNHRPYTYPPDRIDIKPGTGRYGGVKYTDYAVGKFIEKARQHPWFADTLFVITADHTAGSARKVELDPERYLIPLLIYAPDKIKPKTISTLSSQIDLAPTLLSLLDMSYESRFWGRDILKIKSGTERAFVSNYQQVGYMTKDKLLVMKPVKQVQYYTRSGFYLDNAAPDPALLCDALSYFQSATNWRIWNSDIEQNATPLHHFDNKR